MTTRKVVLLTGALLTCRHFEEVDRRQWRRGAAQHPGYARDAQSGDSLYGLFMYSYRNCRLTGDAVVYLIRRSLRLEICTGTGTVHTVRVLYEGPVPYRHVKAKCEGTLLEVNIQSSSIDLVLLSVFFSFYDSILY